jgi:hypothetical protein
LTAEVFFPLSHKSMTKIINLATDLWAEPRRLIKSSSFLWVRIRFFFGPNMCSQIDQASPVFYWDGKDGSVSDDY